ncbi:hypothetical protein GSI_05968 [Ganoderma sinense ZZ0214-1]|uniref:T cell CD4 receptor C-terminal region domain-containing protein n=1 Tax=Ganoderma sinense ZZ0214-1 TaxID=1077348 RepID=A0A2G8SBY6_9APHY|nr:hypothetical protein GSI_05968 [Ganoderma sinense ZZ0214-1]
MVGRPLILSSFLFLSHLATATRTNRTIDDEKGDSVSGLLPEFSPPGAWHQGSTCGTACLVHLDPSQTLDGTWHDATYEPNDPEPRSITMRFNGTAVYVYNVLANTVAYADTGTNITFALDGSPVGHYRHIPRNTTLFDYNVPVYSNGTLQNTEHQLVIQAAGAMQSPSLILFDYVVYTFDDTPTATATTKNAKQAASKTPVATTQSSPSTAAIVGAVVGGVVALLILVGIFVFICIRRRRRRQSVHIQVIEEKRRRRRALPRLSILASELGPPSAATNEATVHSARSLMGTPAGDVESQHHDIGISQRSPLPLLAPISARSPKVLHEGQGSARSHAGSTALESPRGVYLFGGKSDVDTAVEASDRPPISLPPALPENSRPRPRRSPNRETVALRSEVATLRKEVEHLREKKKTKTIANNTSEDEEDNVDAPPPEYDGPGDSGGHQ